MGRLERNIRRKKRRRIIIFSLLAITLLFISGIRVTNEVMVQMTGLSQEKDIFSEYSIGRYVNKINEIRSEVQWIDDVKIIIKSSMDRIQKLVEGLINRI